MKLFAVILALAWASAEAKSKVGTKWEKCSTFGSGRCFKTKLNEVIVQVGKQGTNDDVFLKICSDYDPDKCCATPALKSKVSDDWSKGDREVWGRRYFGKDCKDKEFKVKNGLKVTLSKNGNGDLNVTSLTIDTISPKKNNDAVERFLCKDFFLTGTSPSQTKSCNTGPYKFMKIEKATVKIGPDGTDDDVKFKICSDTDGVCCEKKLSHLLKDDWKKNNTEVWESGKFGDCGDMFYKVTNAATVSILKDGKDDLDVSSIQYVLKTNEAKPSTITYSCNGFKLTGDCKRKALCTQPLACTKSTGGATSTRKNNNNNRRNQPTRRPIFG